MINDKAFCGIKMKPAKTATTMRPKGWFRITKEDSSITGGAHYQVDLVAANSFGAFIWLCPVTLFVLGQYPDYMWIKPLDLNDDKMKKLGLKD